MTRARSVILAISIGLAAAAAVPAHACAACGNPDVKSPMIDAAKAGMGILLGLTLVVQGGFVVFFVHLRRRAQRFQDQEIQSEWSELQRSSSTS